MLQIYLVLKSVWEVVELILSNWILLAVVLGAVVYLYVTGALAEFIGGLIAAGVGFVEGLIEWGLDWLAEQLKDRLI